MAKKNSTKRSTQVSSEYTPTEWMADPANLREAIITCLTGGDHQALIEMVKGHYKALEFLGKLGHSKVSQSVIRAALRGQKELSVKELVHLISGIFKAGPHE